MFCFQNCNLGPHLQQPILSQILWKSAYSLSVGVCHFGYGSKSCTNASGIPQSQTLSLFLLWIWALLPEVHSAFCPIPIPARDRCKTPTHFMKHYFSCTNFPAPQWPHTHVCETIIFLTGWVVRVPFCLLIVSLTK